MSRVVTGQGGNSASVRIFNERVILGALRRLGQASKADLARYARFTDNTAGVIVRDLAARNLIRIEGKRVGARGQPATLLSLNAEGAYSIGVKIGRRTIDATLVDFAGRVLEHSSLERSFPLPEEAVALTLTAIDALLKAVPPSVSPRVAGLGVAMPYNMGSWRRELDIPDAAYEAWNDFDIAAVLAERTGLPVIVENDGTAAAVAELFNGLGREIDSFVYLFIGTAIGGGVVLDGNYQRGKTGNAGDFGLISVAPSHLSSAPRPDGPFDILLTRASIGSLTRHLRGHQVAAGPYSDLKTAIDSHPALVEEWLEDCVDALVLPILSAARILDVGVVVLDSVMPRELLDDLVGRLRAALAAAGPKSRDAPEVLVGKVGHEAAAIGAAILPLHLNFYPNPSLLVGHESTIVQGRLTA